MANTSRPKTGLWYWRKQQGITQERLAEQIIVGVRSIQRWESGEGQPGPESCLLLKKRTGLTVEELGLVRSETVETTLSTEEDCQPKSQASTSNQSGSLLTLQLFFVGSLLLLSAVVLLVALLLWR